jgi:hypothetical protein
VPTPPLLYFRHLRHLSCTPFTTPSLTPHPSFPLAAVVFYPCLPVRTPTIQYPLPSTGLNKLAKFLSALAITTNRLCMPILPFGNPQKSRQPPFYTLDAQLLLVLAIASTGLQHALAMLAGLITPPIIFASALSLDSSTSAT